MLLHSFPGLFDEDEDRAKEAATKAAKKAAAKERDAARAEAAKVKFAPMQAKEDAELAAGRRVVREEIMSLAALLIRWKETTSDNSDVRLWVENSRCATHVDLHATTTQQA